MNHRALWQGAQMLVQVVIRADLTDEAGQVGHRNIVALCKTAIDGWVRPGGGVETHPGTCDRGGRHPILVGCGGEKRGLVGIADVIDLTQIYAELKCVAASLLCDIVHEVQDRNMAIDARAKGVDVRYEAKVHEMRVL